MTFSLRPPPDPRKYANPQAYLDDTNRWQIEVWKAMMTVGSLSPSLIGGKSYATTAVSTTIATDILQVTAVATITIPTAVGKAGMGYAIDNAHAGVTTVLPTGSETIEGSASQTITGNAVMVLYSDGANWRIT